MQIIMDKIHEILSLSEPCSSYEGLLQARWNRIPLNVPLTLHNRQKLVVLSRGIWNFESGPDFRQAKIMIDDEIRTGDVEIHKFEGDWVRHGHSVNPEYRNVVLHVVEEPENPKCGALPTFCLLPEEEFRELPPALFSARGKCAEKFELIEPDKIRDMFVAAGLERMHQRAEIILHDMIETGIASAFRARLFDAFGFKRNRKAFGELLNCLRKKYPEELFRDSFEPLIWGESGLLPVDRSGKLAEDTVENAKKIWETWWHLRKDSGSPIEWKRDGGRPLNSPERRLAGLCLFLKKFGMNPLSEWLNLLKNSFSAPVFCKDLLQSLILNDDFWNSHTTFRAGKLKFPAAVMGEERAREMAVDVIMPALRALAMLQKDDKMIDRVDAAFKNLPKTQKNRVLTTALDKWFSQPGKYEKLFSDAASRQGVLHLYSNYCFKISCDCGACLINNTMFSKS